MDTEPYRTVVGRGSGEVRDRGSRFIATVDRVATVADADAIRDGIASDHPDASHVVPAYRVRADPFREFASDAGEPSGSAGDPIMAVLRGRGLENVIAVVVRYYGGTNLGIGGLVRAYQGAVRAAIEDAGIEERRPRSRLVVETSYDDSGTVRGILEGSDATFSARYEEAVSFAVDVPVAQEATLIDRLLDATSGRADVSRG